MISGFLDQAKKGDPVFITDVRQAFESASEAERAVLELTLADGVTVRTFDLRIPAARTKEERGFARDYLHAEIYNTLTTLGGRRMDIHVQRSSETLRELLHDLNDVFGTDTGRAERRGYGRVLNVVDRILGALAADASEGSPPSFTFRIHTGDALPDVSPEAVPEPVETDLFRTVTEGLDDQVICGLDIGGTDVKAAVVVNGRLAGLKEYDWFPEGYATAEEIVDPILILVRLLRARAYAADSAAKTLLDAVMPRETSYTRIREAVEEAEKLMSGRLTDLDAIGLCFPDVVVKNKIVGGEVPKTRGMRANRALDYEKEFAKITDLDTRLLELCAPNGVVMNTNDGPMAAFTAAVELAASGSGDDVRRGVFAHSLGTDLGSGWVHSRGEIPEIPLEVYNLIIDIGSYPERGYDADDVRSINNTNTGLAGSLQKYTSQSGVFRLAAKLLSRARPDLYQELFDLGLFRSERANDGTERIVVPTRPQDMRKACLAHLMELARKESDETVCELFRRTGVFLGVTWQETERILQTGLRSRYLFGRLVKVQRCFDLMKEGAARRAPLLRPVAADSEMAFTPLMKQLDADPAFTVAQFGQAIGAIYFANMGLKPRKGPDPDQR